MKTKSLLSLYIISTVFTACGSPTNNASYLAEVEYYGMTPQGEFKVPDGDNISYEVVRYRRPLYRPEDERFVTMATKGLYKPNGAVADFVTRNLDSASRVAEKGYKAVTGSSMPNNLSPYHEGMYVRFLNGSKPMEMRVGYQNDGTPIASDRFYGNSYHLAEQDPYVRKNGQLYERELETRFQDQVEVLGTMRVPANETSSAMVQGLVDRGQKISSPDGNYSTFSQNCHKFTDTNTATLVNQASRAGLNFQTSGSFVEPGTQTFSPSSIAANK